MGTVTARRPTIKGVAPLLTVNDLALLMNKPTRFVRGLIKSGALKAIKLGGNSWRVTPAEFDRFVAKGATGYRHAAPSGGVRTGMWGATGGGEEDVAEGEYPRGTE
ncbi:MAG TPA: helix-turn-helix domain-containing protein [Kiritimatiellia bacterium]|nr:helix-turn-helix domain-containing protein [Kiritimatiellia bacterium]HRU70196.1 helix-turn-helix domain-containing protein [Kiritimatiellia bacterium]